MVKREFDIFELVKILLQNRVLIITLVAIVSILAVIYSLTTPEIYRSEASFYAVGSSTAGLPFDVGGLSSLASGIMGMDSYTDATNFVTVMESRTFKEDVIRKFKLIEYFELKQKDPMVNMDNALNKMLRVVAISLGEKNGLISISAETKDKALSKNIVTYYLDRLDEYNRIQKVTKGKRNREFLGKRVDELRSNIDSLLIATRDFQQKNKTIDLETQSQALIKSYSDIISEKMKLDIQLELAETNFGADTPVIKQLKTQRDALIKQIKSLESDKTGFKPEYLIDIASIPNSAVKMAQIKLNLEIAQKILEYLYPQYEAAKLEELRDMPSIEIVDSPREAGKRVRPKRAVICVISAFMAFLFGVIIALLKDLIIHNKSRFIELRDVFTKKHDSSV